MNLIWLIVMISESFRLNYSIIYHPKSNQGFNITDKYRLNTSLYTLCIKFPCNFYIWCYYISPLGKSYTIKVQNPLIHLFYYFYVLFYKSNLII